MNARVNTNNLFAKIDIPRKWVGRKQWSERVQEKKVKRKEKSHGSTYSNCVAFI